jgi:GDP-4-dehydro-6-deoxy-D-mannose reductase
MQRVAVFGASGFSGRHFERFVTREGLAKSYAFFGHTRHAARTEQTGSFTYHEGDPCREGEVSRFIAEVRPDYILNLVGMFRAEELDDFLRVHVGVSRAICEAVLASGLEVNKLVLVGSAAEYGSTAPNPVREDARAEPINWYGLSKLYQTLLADYFFRNHGLPTVVARSFNILGEGLSRDLSIGSFMSQIDSLPDGGVMKVGNISTSRDFLDIDELSRRYWTLLMKGRPGEIFNLCSGEPRTIRSVLEDLIRRSGKRIEIEVDSLRLKAREVESIYGDPSKFEQLAR